MRPYYLVLHALRMVGQVLATPTPNDKHGTRSQDVSIQSRQQAACERMNDIYGPTPQDWEDHKASDWFSDWIDEHIGDDADKQLDSAWGEWAFGDPTWNCADDGSVGCQLPDFCDNSKVNELSDDDLRMAYYVTLSLINLRSYHVGLREALSDSAIYASLATDQWVQDFYKDDEKDLKGMREGLLSMGIVIGVLASFINPFLGEASMFLASAFVGAGSLIANTVPGAIMPMINNELGESGAPAREADLGAVLARFFNNLNSYLTKSNNAIMQGSGANKDWEGPMLFDYLNGGGFVAFEGVDKRRVKDTMEGMLLGTAVNHLWRTQKVGIVGGLPCNEDLGIGHGPDESVCRDGKAWYIYHWDEQKKLGGQDGEGVIAPHGMDLLGKDEYGSVTYKDAILSSLAAWDTAKLDYNKDTMLNQAKLAIDSGNTNLFGPNWEGIFSIPVCDAGLVPYVGDFKHKDTVLTPYGPEQEPRWCGPICDIDQLETDKFLKVANMENFDDNPKDHC